MDAGRLLLEENGRLRREVAELRERVDAFERSRWWRLHPRFLGRRAVRAVTAADDGTPEGDGPVPESHVDSTDGVVQRFKEEVVERGSFTRDGFSHRIPSLVPHLSSLPDTRARVLEIGSYEGLSTCFFLWWLPESHVTAIDTFAPGLEVGELAGTAAGLEHRFDLNVAAVGAGRARKLVGDSRHLLLDLIGEEAVFDLVYVDGSHLALDVVVDAALSWQLVARGGLVVFDDYALEELGDDPLLRPGPALDAFRTIIEGRHEVLHAGYRLVVRKLVPAS
jgi:predicted O-methyltransferase YrrM